MTEFDIQKELFDHFKTLNTFSGITYLITDTSGNYTNVHFPNIPFTVPSDKRWFDLTFRNNDPVDSSLGEDSQYRFTGVLYIDIYSPMDANETEVKTKYSWIAKLFNKVNLDYIDIMKVYISTKGNDADCYRLQVAIEWEADIDKEIKE